MTVCPACSQENPEGFRFCGSCGSPIGGDARPREERKVVTVLFADLVGFTGRAERLDPEDVRAMLSPYYARLRSELERRGGTVEKFIGDAVMAIFGAPVAHEDDPERAVRAALAIRDAIRDEEGLQVRIAVNTGEALVSLDAKPSTGEGMAAGDVVNTTARLQTAAPVNGILVGETTYRATHRGIEYREAPPVEAKGKTDSIPVWEAVQAYSRIAVETLETGAPLIGRRRELDVLTGALERARQERTSQLVTLVGVPGIGKSRLVYELFKAIEEEPDLVFWRQGRALPYGEGVTYWALAEMVKAHAGVLETDSLSDVEQKLTKSVFAVLGESPEAEWVELHLRRLVGPATSSDVSGDRRAESFAAWRRFFEALAEQNPLVLIFDDLHWADDDLLDFIDHLVDWASSVEMLVVCAARPELLDRRPAWGGGKLNAATVSVTPLSDEETAELIGALLERTLLPAEIQATLLAHAGGNPLYAEQFVRMHLERGGAAPALPETVQGIISARLDVLPAAEKALLQDAAVMGKVFWLGAAIGELDPGAVEALLHALERKDFIRRERRSSVAGETEYSFRHVLVQDVAYAQIPRAARAEKHRLAAAWIESLSDDRADERAEMLAHHYLAALEFARAAGNETADLRDRARLALRVAAERAMALSAFAAAARFFESALELWPADDAERPKLLLRYGEALAEIGRSAAADVLEEARDASLGTGMVEEAAEAVALLGQVRVDQGLPNESLDDMDRAVALVQDRGASASKARVYAQAARRNAIAGRLTEAIRLSDVALGLAEELELPDTRGYTLNTRGMVRVVGGDLSGIEDLEASIEIAGERRTADLARAYGNLASIQVDLGDLRRARDLHQRGVEAASRMGQENDVRWLASELSIDRYLVGEWGEALHGFDRGIAESLTSPFFMEAPCRQFRALIRLARGNFAGALEDSERGLAIAESSGADPQMLLPALASAALCGLEMGDEGRAASLADRLLADMRNNELLAHWWYLEFAFVLVGLGRSGEVGHAAAGFPTPTRWLDAATLYAGGEMSAAAGTLAEMGARPFEAYVRLRAADELVALGRRSEADVELRKALDFWYEVGASTYVRRGEALLPASA